MHATIRSAAHRVLYESGLASVRKAGVDALLLIAARACRMFANGAAALVLALFFDALDVSESRIGLFMTLTLVGDVVLSLLLTLVADRVGRRRTLVAGSVLMVLSGVAFALWENYWVLLLAAVVGVISATGGDFGPFRAIEESVLSELTGPETRADVLVWYIMASSLGSAVGTEVAGRAVEWLRQRDGWTLLDAYHTCFWAYAAMGALNVVSSILLSHRCELKVPGPKVDSSEEAGPFLDDEEEEDHEDDGGDVQEEASPPKGRFAQISKETRSIMYALWFLLMVDSLADGMVSMSLTTFFMDQKFQLAKSVLGDVLSASYILAACSTIFSGPLSRHIGLVNTMVFTHIPSSTAVLLFPLFRSETVTFALLLLRVGLNNMDQAPRAALIAAVVKPDERTAVMGITSMLRTLASTTGPTVTGFLAGSKQFWIAFVVAGALRLAYDVGLFVMFINIQLYKHERVSKEDKLLSTPIELQGDIDHREDSLEEQSELNR